MGYLTKFYVGRLRPEVRSLTLLYTIIERKGTPVLFLVCNHVTRRPCWGSKEKNISSKNLHENRVSFPEERNAFVLDHQHGRRDVTCKPAIGEILVYIFCLISIGLSLSDEANKMKFLNIERARYTK